MDISKRWTIDERMRLPDWCFGNRTLIGVYSSNFDVGTYSWEISELSFPDPVCLWSFGFCGLYKAGDVGWLRVGLSKTVPTSVAEMDATTEIIPCFGLPHAGPNAIYLNSEVYVFEHFEIRKGIKTGGEYLVMENRNIAGLSRLHCWFIVSELPTNISGWLAESFLLKVR